MVAEESRYQQEIADLKTQYLQTDEMTREDYSANAEMIELTHLQNQLKIAGLEPAEREKIMQKVLDAEIAFKNKAADIQEKVDKDNEDKAISRREKKFQLDMEAAAQYHYQNMTSDEEYMQAVSSLENEYWSDLLNNYKLTEEERTRIKLEQDKRQTDSDRDKFEKAKERSREYADIAKSTAEDFGDTIGKMIANGELSMHNFIRETLLMAVDALERIVEVACVEVMVKNIAATTPFSWIGAAKAAAEIVGIKAAFAVVKGLISNFYDGGYTPSGSWDQPQGIVHSNEFVSNWFAVSNPQLRPVLDLIDAAQRSGSVQNLTAGDVASVLPYSSQTRYSTAVQSSSSVDMTVLMGLVGRMTGTVKKLTDRLEQPFYTISNVSGDTGVKKALTDYEKLLKNKSRS